MKLIAITKISGVGAKLIQPREVFECDKPTAERLIAAGGAEAIRESGDGDNEAEVADATVEDVVATYAMIAEQINNKLVAVDDVFTKTGQIDTRYLADVLDKQVSAAVRNEAQEDPSFAKLIKPLFASE